MSLRVVGMGILIVLGSISAQLALADDYELAVYCDTYQDNGTNGYSIYRQGDHADLGNAVFDDVRQCNAASRAANDAQAGIFCGVYNSNGVTGFSLYQIWTGSDIGAGVFNDFGSCQDAVRQTQYNKTCAPYNDGQYSQYDVVSGGDIGNDEYDTLQACFQALRDGS